jgi:hypothetical protein
MNTALEDFDLKRTVKLAVMIDALLADHVGHGHSPRETSHALCLTMALMVLRSTQEGIGSPSEMKATACGDVGDMIDAVARMAAAQSNAADAMMEASATVPYSGRA